MNNETIDFQRDVIEASHQKPVVIDFWADWCAPCRMLGPVLEKLAAKANGAWKLVKINTELQQDIAMQFQISSIPAVKMIYKGEIVDEFIGALPESQIVQWLEKNVPSESKEAFNNAMKALQAGDRKNAEKLLNFAIEQDEENLEAKIIRAKLLFQSEPEQAIKLVENIEEGDPLYDQVEAMRTLWRLKTDYSALKNIAQKNGSAAWKDYLNGIQEYLHDNYEKALDSWIDSIIVDRNVDEDGARKACVALFTLMGHENEITKKYHRQFSSALY